MNLFGLKGIEIFELSQHPMQVIYMLNLVAIHTRGLEKNRFVVKLQEMVNGEMVMTADPFELIQCDWFFTPDTTVHAIRA